MTTPTESGLGPVLSLLPMYTGHPSYHLLAETLRNQVSDGKENRHCHPQITLSLSLSLFPSVAVCASDLLNVSSTFETYSKLHFTTTSAYVRERMVISNTYTHTFSSLIKLWFLSHLLLRYDYARRVWIGIKKSDLVSEHARLLQSYNQ